jgi:aldehyde:ferredoxin oxidoreductase
MSKTQWLDDSTDAPMIHDYAHRLAGFMDAMADGKIESSELKDQEARLVAQMKKVEPELNDRQHEMVTQLLCELTAYNIMHTLHELMAARPKTKFRG